MNNFSVNVASRLKLGTLFSILIINILFGILFWKVLLVKEISPLQKEFWYDQSSKIAGITVFLLEIFALYFLFSLKKIIVEKDKIIFKSLIFPFIKKQRFFSYYDCIKIVDEDSKTHNYESLWLIKDRKLEDHISSYHYSNYTKLKFEIKVKHNGKLKLYGYSWLLRRVGFRKI